MEYSHQLLVSNFQNIVSLLWFFNGIYHWVIIWHRSFAQMLLDTISIPAFLYFSGFRYIWWRGVCNQISIEKKEEIDVAETVIGLDSREDVSNISLAAEMQAPVLNVAVSEKHLIPSFILLNTNYPLLGSTSFALYRHIMTEWICMGVHSLHHENSSRLSLFVFCAVKMMQMHS